MRLQTCRAGFCVAGGLAVLLLAAGPAFAQPMYPAQGYPYGTQYAPAPQMAYSQPQGYGQAQPYSGYPQQGYPQQGTYSQQGYGQTQGYTQQSYGKQPGYAVPQQGYVAGPGAGQPLNASQLEQMVAPIALYPDTLVAQVLAAATYPAQVADADRWLAAQG